MEFVTSTPKPSERYQDEIQRKPTPSPPKSPKSPSPRLERNTFYGSSDADNVHQIEEQSTTPHPHKVKPFNKANSSNSFLTHELMDKLINNAYGFDNYHPEDFSSHNHEDGSNLVAPTSKLAIRKISAHRKISTDSCQSDDSMVIIFKFHLKRMCNKSISIFSLHRKFK